MQNNHINNLIIQYSNNFKKYIYLYIYIYIYILSIYLYLHLHHLSNNQNLSVAQLHLFSI